MNFMLATSCQQGQLDVVRLLVHGYAADTKDCAVHSDEFAVITGLPLYAAAQAGRVIYTNNPSLFPTQIQLENKYHICTIPVTPILLPFVSSEYPF